MNLYEIFNAFEEATKIKGLSDYCKKSFDDNGGFLRTRWIVYKDKLINNKKIKDFENVLITSMTEIKEPLHTNDGSTLLRLQLFYDEEGKKFDEWSDELGYQYQYLLNIKNKTISLIQKEV